jgi:hypothetical protein
MGQWAVSVRRHKPPSESGIHPGRFPRGVGIGRVDDRYITSPRQVHDRLYQIQSLRGDTGNPCDMMTPLVQRPDPRAVSLATAPYQSSTRRQATRTWSPPPWSLDEMARADPAAGPGCGTNRASRMIAVGSAPIQHHVRKQRERTGSNRHNAEVSHHPRSAPCAICPAAAQATRSSLTCETANQDATSGAGGPSPCAGSGWCPRRSG